MKKIIAANWKLNKSPAQAREFFNSWKNRCPSPEVEVVFFPSAFALATAAECLKATAFKFGPQNVFFKTEGAFTGENSALVAREMGSSYLLIGHSERRSLFGETEEVTADKIQLAQSLGLTPMFCIGETLQERESGRTKAILERQLQVGLSKADAKKALVIAYEPVWAIGTGRVASSEQVAETHTQVAEMLARFGFGGTPILYGGSVKPENAGALSQQKNVSGFLIGGAALEVESLAKIIENSK